MVSEGIPNLANAYWRDKNILCAIRPVFLHGLPYCR
jgi:hypothetical protein